MSSLSLLLWFVCLATESQLTEDKKVLERVALSQILDFRNDSTRIRNGRGKTREKGLENMKKAQGRKMKIEIPVGKGRPSKPDQSINLDEHYVKDSCEDILKNRSRQWRYKLKQPFENARSDEEARKIEVPELTPENWNRLCDMWINPEHKGKTNPEGVEPDRIEFYKHTHYTSEKGWSSLEAETHYLSGLPIPIAC
uniref:Uncharacterized protein n=1 Tax=Solanum tuberosum TaxID=4113 RepID=M1BN92_SOLTU